MTMSTDTPSTPGPTNHDRSHDASPDSDAQCAHAYAAKIIAVESATSLSHSLAPRQAHITPLTLFSDHALLGPLGASLLPRSPPPPLTPHYVTDAFLSAASHQHVGPAGLPLASPAAARVLPPAQPHGHAMPAAAHAVVVARPARRASVCSGSSPSSSSTGNTAPAVKRTRKPSLPADHLVHHPYRRRTSSSSSSSSTPAMAASTPPVPSHAQIPIHQLAAAPARNRHPKHLTLPTTGPHASLPTTTLLYSSATTFTACASATAIVGTGARKRPRAISTPATFAALRGSGPEAVAVGPIEAWSHVASARAFLTREVEVEVEVEVKMEEVGSYLV